MTRPVRELKAFQKVALAPGESKVVEFTLKSDDLQFVGRDNRWLAEPGQFDVWIAPSAQSDGAHTTFELQRA